MISRRRIRVLAITASCAALAVLGVTSSAMASNNVATTGKIKACYKTSGSLPPLDHVAATGKCPAGDSSLTWNKTGPRGPAGLSTGISASSATGIALNTGVNNFVPVLSTPAVSVAGTYYVNASVMVYIAQGDGVDCIIGVAGGPQNFAGLFADVDPVAVSGFETLPMAQAVSLTAGENLDVYCGDYTANAGTAFYDGGLTGTLISSATGNAVKPSLATSHRLSPRP